MRRRTPALLVGAALACVSPAGPAMAAQKAIWGPTTLPNGKPAFPIYHRLGIDSFQAELDWGAIAPSEPTDPTNPNDPAYKWPVLLDQAATAAATYGIKLCLLITHTPPWANGGQSNYFPPTNDSDFDNFVVAAARRYPQVRIWMIWGEPNISFRFEPQGKAGAERYASLLDSAYGTLKGLSLDNIVVGGNTWTGGIPTSPVNFLDWMRLPDGKPPRLDWYGQNPYPVYNHRFPSLHNPTEPHGYRDISDMHTFSHEVERVYHRVVPLWLSEFTIQSDRTSQIFKVFVSRREQAKWVTAAYKLADQLGSRVAGLGWFTLIDEQPEASNSTHWGLLTTSLKRKPAFYAFERARSERLAPIVSVARTVSTSTLHAGIRVTVGPRIKDRFEVALELGSKVLARASFTAAAKHSFRLRAGRRRGRYTIVVASTRGSTERIAVTVN